MEGRMPQPACDPEGPPKESSSRYHLPDWFLERNVKAHSDLTGSVCICHCKACEDYKNLYEDEETEDQPSANESTAKESNAKESNATESTPNDSEPKEDSHSSAEKHENGCEDAISYEKFSELRDMVATTMLWRHTRPQDSSVLLRRCSVSGCGACQMEPLYMNDMVSQVAKSLGMGMVSLSFEDLEQLGGDFHAQDKANAASSDENKTTENKSAESTKEAPSTMETSAGEGTATEASPDKGTENKTEATSDEATTPKEPTKDDWKPKWSDGTTFIVRFFAARSKKWQDEPNFSYSAWRERAKESYTAILDGSLAKVGQKGRPQDRSQAENAVASSSRGLLVHFVDCDRSYAGLDYRQQRRIMVRLAELVQERRREGQDVVLVISSRTIETTEKLAEKAGVSAISGVTLSIVNPSKKKSEERDLRRKASINTRRLRCILEAGAVQPSSARPTIEWLPSADGDELARYGKELWSFDDIHRAAGQITARTWMKPRPIITSKQVDSTLRRLGMLTKPNAADKTESGEAETKGTEVVEEAEKDPLENIALDDYEEKFRDCVVKPKDLKVSWDDIILDQDTKEMIQNLVPSSKLEVEASSDFLLQQLRIRGCLLYGPPGTGKTHLCRAIASASGSRMLSIDYATTQSCWVGEAEKAIRAAFSLAAKLSPCVLFIDEADALFYRRGSGDKSWERSATTQFLVEMEGLAQKPDAPLVVVATNRPWDLDEAFLRRLPQKFCIGLPDRDARAAILRLFLKDGDLDPAVDVDGIADVTKGFSGSDLKSLCAEAALMWKVEQVRLDKLYGAVALKFATARKAPKRLRLDVNHFAAAFEKMQPNKTPDMAAELERFERRYNPAQGELGRGNGGKRYIFNGARGKNEAFSVRELISRPAPSEEVSPANMQIVVWRSAEDVLFPGRATTVVSETPSPLSATARTEKQSSDKSAAAASDAERPKDPPVENGVAEPKAQSAEVLVSSPGRAACPASETASPPPATTGMEEQNSEESVTVSSDDERPKTPENDLTEPKAESAEAVPRSEFDSEKPHVTPEHEDLCTPDSPSTMSDATTEIGAPEPAGPDQPGAGPLAPELAKMTSGADVDLIPLLVTLASVFWYSRDGQ